jgi:micrococcal nuclease
LRTVLLILVGAALLVCFGCLLGALIVPAISRTVSATLSPLASEPTSAAAAAFELRATDPAEDTRDLSTTLTPAPAGTTPPVANNSGEVAGDMATVTRVIDGDTIEVSINAQTHRLRYIGMDTPERGQPFFGEATEANARLVSGQSVILVKDVSETDRYGRLLRYVYLQDGTFVNAELVRLGYAQIATHPPDVRHQELFLQLQQEARDAGVGLWASAAAMPPVPTPAPEPVSTSEQAQLPTQPPPAAAGCDPAYPDVCIPSPTPDLDCGNISFRNFRVLSPDPHRFDGDHDGIGCES